MNTVCQEDDPQHVKTVEDTILTIKYIVTVCLLLNNRRRQFFGATNKTMDQLLNDVDTA